MLERMLLEMLVALLQEARDTQHLGSGYYTCSPFIERYNKLLGKVKEILPEEKSILDTFSPLEDAVLTDPLSKSKVMEKIIVETGQLIAFLKSAIEKKKKGGKG
mgnify:CR=1 FL=1